MKPTPTDAFSLLRAMPWATMLPAVLNFNAAQAETAFLINEQPARLDTVAGEQTHIEIRSGLMVLDNVALIPLLIRLDRNPDLTYQTWLNYHDSGLTRLCCDYLTRQELIYVLFFTGDIRPARGFTVGNSLQIGVRAYLQALKNRCPWSGEDFERAQAKLSRQYPSPLALWRTLTETGETK